MNHTASPLLRLPAELRNKIFQSSIAKNLFVLEDPSQAPVLVMNNIGVLSSCRQIYHEVKGLVPFRPRPVLRIGENVHPRKFFRVNYENRGYGEYKINSAIQVLEISGAFFKVFYSDDSIYRYLQGYQPYKSSGWLPEIFPNLKRIVVDGFDLQHSEDLKFCMVTLFENVCFGISKNRRRVEYVFV